MTTAILRIDGMHCGGCERNVEFALSSLPGVSRVKADHGAETVEIAFDPSATVESELRRAIEEIGYRVVVVSLAPTHERRQDSEDR